MENIYKRLANGESSDAIAAEFTAALNEAMARYAKDEEEKAAKVEAERLARLEKEAKTVQKREDMIDVLNCVFRYIAKYYPELGLEEGDWDSEDLRTLAELCIAMLDLEVLKICGCVKPKPATKPKATPVELDAFAKFFKGFGL